MTSLVAVIAENNNKTTNVDFTILAGATDAQCLTYINAAKTVSLGKFRDAYKRVSVAGFTPDATQAGFGAQRGQKWRHKGTGADGDIYTFSMGCADSGQLNVVGSDYVNLAVAPWAAYKTALQAIWADGAGGAMTLTSVEYKNVPLQ